MNSQAFQGQVALITGGSQGIGKAVAIKLASLGCHVIIVARGYDQISLVVDEINSKYQAACVGFKGDVTNWGEMKQCFSRIKRDYGKLDILVNSAGTNIPKGILETSLEEWENVISVNLTGTFICCKLSAELMVEQNSGVIINVSSVQSRVGGRSVQYSASKAGVEGLTKSLAKQLANHKVRVISVAPGATETEMAKNWTAETREKLIKGSLLGRIAFPDEIANVIVFAASSDASYITGTTLNVNGGYHLD